MYDFLKIPYRDSRVILTPTKTRASSSCSDLTWQSHPPREADGMGGLMTVSPKRETESTYRN